MSGQRRYKTVYTCDVCHVAVFPTLREAEVHEAQCQGPPPSSRPRRHHPHDADGSNAPSRGVHEATSGPATTKERQGRKPAIDNEVISIESSSDESSQAHAQDATNNRREEKMPSTSGEQHAYKEDGKSPSYTTKSDDKEAQQADQANDTAPTDASQENAQNMPHDDDIEYTTVWICDICKLARFETYEQAVAHENKCEGLSESGTHTNVPTRSDTNTNLNLQSLPSTYPSKSGGHNAKKILLLSPVVHTHDSTELSLHFFTILQSLDLFYDSYSGLISFHCHYCSTALPISGASWNLNRVVGVLPHAVTTHLRGIIVDEACAKVPPTVFDKLNPMENVVSAHVRSFQTFIQNFFRETNIEARKTDELYFYSNVASSEDARQLPSGSKKRQGSGKAREQSPPKRQKAIPFPVSVKVKQHGNMGASLRMNEQGNQFYLAPYAPLDGVPLVSSISSKESKKLPLPLQVLLQQVEFFNLSSLTISTEEEALDPKAVGIRCQNCVSCLEGCGYIALSSVNDIATDLWKMSTDHILCCKCTETSVRNILKAYSVADLGGLTKYCHIVTKIYGLEDTTSGGASVVVWGECQAVPSGYIGSPNINIDFAML